MLALTQEKTEREDLYASFMVFGRAETNVDIIARMLASRRLGEGAMPPWLGLSEERFASMLQAYFPGAMMPEGIESGEIVDPARMQEGAELRTLILNHAETLDEKTRWMAEVLVAGCMGGDHLWQDLGLWSRKDLSRLIAHNFPALAAKNDKDMKWKKFLYKQLCNAEGIYVCRSPSCEVCPDYSDCFGPEE